LDICGIMRSIPHRYPFLLVDRIVEMEPGQRIVALKNVSFNEPFFQGHFPGAPIMPGVLIIEAMAQTGAVLLLHDMEGRESKLVYFTGIDKDQLRFTLEVLKLRSRTCKMKGRAEVDGQLAAEAEILSALVDRST
jgi:beta-hydroxyacyl-ACP dehydratase FabZ